MSGMNPVYDRETFLSLPTGVIADFVRKRGKPQVGIFVPDGNQRLVIAKTNLQKGSEEFFVQVALTQTALGLNALKVFFSHGLPILFVPLFSHSALTRGVAYRRLTALKTLRIIFTERDWLDFYDAFNVRVRVYGDLSVLAHADFEDAPRWIEQVQRDTQAHKTHILFIGIGGKSLVGYDAAQAAARFYQLYQREPSLDELIEFIYGEPIPRADFFIMSNKMAGLGALPALICDGDTQSYYLAAPGVIGITERSYRAILYDLLYMRDDIGPCDSEERKRLHAWYTSHAESVLGLGYKIGAVWVPYVPENISPDSRYV